MSVTRVLTGITTTGTPHLGNYVGAIRPAIAASRRAATQSFFFLADYHALVKCDDPARVERSRRELAATWLACGLDADQVIFYRQSDIPEIPELAWLLACVCGKGLMNRAHAYKAAVDANLAAGEDADAGVTMGLYGYPVLMAADILMFNAHQVPVGRDQVQHIEMARDIAGSFNHLFGRGGAPFTLPEAVVEQHVALVPGLDGRKMSKSYDNAIALFEGGAAALKDAIARIVTDSKGPGEAKDPQNATVYTLYSAFAAPEQAAAFCAALLSGLSWGEAKQQLFTLIEAELAPARARYEALMARPAELEEILLAGAAKARAIAAPFMAELRHAVGLRRMSAPPAGQTVPRPTAAAKAAAPPLFKQYRQADGRFYFKLSAADGRTLLQSQPFDSGREAGAWVARLKAEGAAALRDAPAACAEGVSREQAAAALSAFQAAEADRSSA